MLAEVEVQEVLDAALFEPGAWQADVPPTTITAIPTAQRDIFATPAGLLMNELRHAPEGLLSSLLALGHNVLDLDVGRYKPRGQAKPQAYSTGRSWFGRNKSGAQQTLSFDAPKPGALALLYVLRLIVRIEGFVVLYLTSNGNVPAARGTSCDDGKMRATLLRVLRELRAMLWDRFFPTIERWCNIALKERDSASACVLLAHLAFLCRNTTPKQLDFRQVTSV